MPNRQIVGHSRAKIMRRLAAAGVVLAAAGVAPTGDAKTTTQPAGTVVVTTPPPGAVVVQGPPASARSAIDVAALAKAVTDVWPRTADIWPGADFSKLSLLLLQTSSATALHPGQAPQPVSPSSPPAIRSIPPGGFGFLKLAGRDAVGLSYPDSYPAALLKRSPPFGVATHEAFHEFVQSKWPRPAQAAPTGRATKYPLHREPREARAELRAALLDALRDPADRGNHLASAAYWWHEWQRVAPAEAKAIRETDAAEGTASYFEHVAIIRTRLGWGAPRSAVAKAVAADVQVTSPAPGADTESYGLGLLAGVLLDEVQPDPSAWKRIVENGTPPVDVLLRDVTPASHENRTRASASVRRTVEKQNQIARPAARVLRAAAQGRRTLLALSVDPTKGSMEITGGFFAATGLPLGSQTFVAGMSTQFATSSAVVVLKNADALDGTRISGCPAAIVVALPAGARAADGRLTLSSGPVQTRGLVVGAARHAGRVTYYCAK